MNKPTFFVVAQELDDETDTSTGLRNSIAPSSPTMVLQLWTQEPGPELNALFNDWTGREREDLADPATPDMNTPVLQCMWEVADRICAVYKI